MIKNKEELIEEIKQGEKVKFLFFWGHSKKKSGEISSNCFSQWWHQPYKVDGIDYPTAEHYMMAEKARLFNDPVAEKTVLAAETPGEAKAIGRKVLNFDQAVWEKHRIEIVVKGNFEKFKQLPELKTYLMNTKNRIIVEASPVDPIWGIGLDRNSEFAPQPENWRGLNLLGFVLMKVRDLLKEQNVEE